MGVGEDTVVWEKRMLNEAVYKEGGVVTTSGGLGAVEDT